MKLITTSLVIAIALLVSLPVFAAASSAGADYSDSDSLDRQTLIHILTGINEE